jgi:hypothetical protein
MITIFWIMTTCSLICVPTIQENLVYLFSVLNEIKDICQHMTLH